MNDVLPLRKHKHVPTDHFGEAAGLIERRAVLIPRDDVGDVCLRGGYRMDDLNEIFTKRWNAFETNPAWMFIQIFGLMDQVQKETSVRETTEARTRLLAILTGLSDVALEKIRGMGLGVYSGFVPAHAISLFCAMADDKRRQHKARNNYGQEQEQSAAVLGFPARTL